MCKQISSDSFKNKITDKLAKQIMYNHLIVCNKWALACLKMLSTVCLQIMYNMYKVY